MDRRPAGKVVRVTGAPGGIGRAIAEAFAEEGAQLALFGNARARLAPDGAPGRREPSPTGSS